MLLEERSFPGVGVAPFLDSTARTLPVVLSAAIVGTLVPRPITLGRRTPEVVVPAIGGERGVLLGVVEGVPALAVVGDVVADASVLVGIGDPDRGSLRRLLHETVIGRPGGNVFRSRPPPAGVKLVHVRDGDELVLATDVDTADSLFSQGLGLMFRRSIHDGYALAFRFDSTTTRGLHMVFVPFAIDAIWTVDGRVTQVKRLSAWTGWGRAEADSIYEVPAGAAADVEPEDLVTLVT